MLSVIEQIIGFFSQNPLFAWLTGGYLAITFGNSAERKKYFDRTWQILISPTNLQEYTNAPESFVSFEGWLKKLLLADIVSSALNGLAESISKDFKPNWKKLTGWMFLIFMLFVFLTADLITIREIAALLGFPINFAEFGLLSYLEKLDYGFAITAGTFFSIVACGFVLLEVTGVAEFSNFNSDTYKNVRTWIIYSSLFVLVSSLVVVILFGLRAYAVAAILPDDTANTYNNWAQFGGNVLVRINAFVVTVLIATEAINGLQSVFAVLILIGLIVLELIYLVTEFVRVLFRVVVDIIYRTFLWLLWTASFWIAKPVDVLLTPIKYLWDKAFGKSSEKEGDSQSAKMTPVKK